MTRLPLAALALSLVLAAPAAADPPPPQAPAQGPYTEGPGLFAIGQSCASIIFGSPRLENQLLAGADFQGSPEGIPAAGEAFYTKLFIGVTGDICGGGSSVLPEFVLPAGVFPAISASRPVFWRYAEDGQALVPGEVQVTTGRFGGITVAADPPDDEPQPWPLANSGGALEIYVPVVSSRRLNGIGTAAPACPEREEGAAPCAADASGDHLQVVAQTACPCAPSTLIPIVGLFAGPPEAPAVQRRPRRALQVRTAPLATVRVAARGRRVTRKAPVSGTVTVRLPRRMAGRVTVTAVTTDGAVSPPARLRIR